MAREDILGGLKSALLRGYSLKDAMISFYNAGYTKEDIEESARTLQYQMVEQPDLKALLMSNHEKVTKPENLPGQAVKKPSEPSRGPVPSKGLVPEVSLEEGQKAPSNGAVPAVQKGNHKFKPLGLYQQKPIPGKAFAKAKGSKYQQGTGLKVATLTLIALLLILLGALAAIFIFRDQIIQFFNNLLK